LLSDGHFLKMAGASKSTTSEFAIAQAFELSSRLNIR
jgi:hypothetical protein